jgi:predicted permease
MRWLTNLFSRQETYADLSQEIQQHLEEKIEELMAGGMAPQQAEQQAKRDFGNVALLEESAREAWARPAFDSIWADVCYAGRQMKRSPGFAIMAIATLATGIAASAAMFTVVDRVLLRPLPYERAGQLVQIKEAGKNGPSMFGAPYLDIEQWRERSQTLAEIAFHTYDKPTSFLEGNSGPVQVNTPRVSTNLFETLGVRPAIGRGFDSSDSSGQKGGAKTAVLSDTVWRDGFGEDPNILGRVIRLNGESYAVVGVMPRGFQFPFNPEKPQIWTAIQLGDTDKERAKNAAQEYTIIARLKEGVTMEAAQAELRVIQNEVAKQYTDAHARENVMSVELLSYADTVVEGGVRNALWALLGAAGVLWLIACLNVTSLLLARAATRQREIAVRAALGASRWRIIRQLFVEGLVLSLTASLLGIGLVFAALRIFERELSLQFRIHVGMAPNSALVLCLLGLTLLSAVISSVWPALVAARASIDPALRQGGARSGGGRHQHRGRGLLVVSQMAMSLALLVACGLLLRTLFALRHVSLGFKSDHVIVADMVIPAYRFDGRNMTRELYQPLVERVEHLSGVEAASLTTGVPLGKRFPILLTFATDENDPASVRVEDLVTQFRAVGPGLQRVFGFRMLSGRFFNEGDTASSQPVIVVNRAFARAYFGKNQGLDKAVGQQLLSYDKEKLAEIVGVVDEERQSSVIEPSQPEVEVCIPQITPKTGFYRVAEGLAMNLAVRTDRNPISFIPEFRRALTSASPELAGSTFTTMDQVVEDSFGDQRMAARLLQIFAGAALLLCVAGLYGLLAYLVSQRTQEFGVRIALGARRGQVITLVIRQAGWILSAGSAIGLALSFFLKRLLASFLYGVQARDALTLSAAVLLLLGTGLAAAYIPARRAASVDPMQALRAE